MRNEEKSIPRVFSELRAGVEQLFKGWDEYKKQLREHRINLPPTLGKENG